MLQPTELRDFLRSTISKLKVHFPRTKWYFAFEDPHWDGFDFVSSDEQFIAQVTPDGSIKIYDFESCDLLETIK